MTNQPKPKPDRDPHLAKPVNQWTAQHVRKVRASIEQDAALPATRTDKKLDVSALIARRNNQ